MIQVGGVLGELIQQAEARSEDTLPDVANVTVSEYNEGESLEDTYLVVRPCVLHRGCMLPSVASKIG